MPKTDELVVDKEVSWWSIDTKKYGSAIIIIVLIIIIVSVCYCKDGFVSPDGVIAGKESRMGVRSDAHIDRTWNIAELEKSVALINRKAGN